VGVGVGVTRELRKWSNTHTTGDRCPPRAKHNFHLFVEDGDVHVRGVDGSVLHEAQAADGDEHAAEVQRVAAYATCGGRGGVSVRGLGRSDEATDAEVRYG